MTTDRGRPQFRTTGRFSEGYAAEDVDAFLDTVFDALASGQQVPDIMTARFAATRGRGGYDMKEVDAFLDELVVDLGEGRGR